VNEDTRKPEPDLETRFSREVGVQATRKLKAQREGSKSIWFGLGMSGLIGWSVTVPTVVGAALGIWVDNRFPGRFSWTLMLLFLGLTIGCVNASYWVASEYKDMQEKQDD
jgi:ATP synthase protein I